MSGLVTFWGLLLAFAIAPFAVFSFLNKLAGNAQTRSARNFVACLGLGPLALSWLLQGLMLAMPGKPHSFHLWTLSGIMALLIAVSERSSYDCAKELSRGLVWLISRSLDALRGWRKAWLSLTLFALAALAFGTVAALCAALPPSDSETLMRLSQARQGFETSRLSPDASSYGGLLVWSFISQGSDDEAGAAKFIAPMFLLFMMLLAAAFPARRLTRVLAAAAAALVLLPETLAFRSLDALYALTLLAYALLEFQKRKSLFHGLLAALALCLALQDLRSSPLPFSSAGQLYATLVALGLLVAAGRFLEGWPKRLAMLAVVLAACFPAAKTALEKAGEFPLAWSFPRLPEVAIADNSVNGRFAIFKYVHAKLPSGSLTITPYPWDFAYYAPDKGGVSPESFPIEALIGPGNGAHLCLPPEGSKEETETFRKLAARAKNPDFAEKVFEADGWRLYKLKPMPAKN